LGGLELFKGQVINLQTSASKIWEALLWWLTARAKPWKLPHLLFIQSVFRDSP